MSSEIYIVKEGEREREEKETVEREQESSRKRAAETERESGAERAEAASGFWQIKYACHILFGSTKFTSSS